MASIIGDNNNNILLGTDEDDFIDGRGGADQMTGLDGGDIYIVDNVGDQAIETSDLGGWDEVRSSVNFTLGDFVENLVLTGTAKSGTGNSFHNFITGNASNNTLRGLAGNDVINGGAGADRMIGGVGDDEYHVDNAGDTIEEAFGHDTIYSSVSFSLGELLEDLYLRGSANINGTGNGADNLIVGNEGNNRLRGTGGNDILFGEGGLDVLEGGGGNDELNSSDGAGGDRSVGGAGNDVYYIDPNDVVVEEAGGGRDRIHAYSDYTLGQNFEDLDLSLASDPVTGIGNSLANVITGHGGQTLRGEGGNDTLNILLGNESSFLFGGAGNDTLIANGPGMNDNHLEGGAGNDSYHIGSGFQMNGIVELAGGGTDTVYTLGSGTLGANLENLVLAQRDGVSSTEGIGNALNNRIVNESGHGLVRLEGLGGNDYLQGQVGTEIYHGGLGSDQFYVVLPEAMGSHQRILDFTHNVDEVLLDNAIFATIGANGALNALAFRNGTEATTARHRIIFDEAQGMVYYDPDGTGAQAQVALFDLGPLSTGMDATDFVVV